MGSIVSVNTPLFIMPTEDIIKDFSSLEIIDTSSIGVKQEENRIRLPKLGKEILEQIDLKEEYPDAEGIIVHSIEMAEHGYMIFFDIVKRWIPPEGEE